MGTCGQNSGRMSGVGVMGGVIFMSFLNVSDNCEHIFLRFFLVGGKYLFFGLGN